jgi:hypothetical protein
MISRKKPGCVQATDAYLQELQEKEDRESLRPLLKRYGCFSKQSGDGSINFEELKELVKKFRLHKQSANFWRDYTTDEALIAVLKRHIRNNPVTLSFQEARGEGTTPRALDDGSLLGIASGGMPAAALQQRPATSLPRAQRRRSSMQYGGSLSLSPQPPRQSSPTKASVLFGPSNGRTLFGHHDLVAFNSVLTASRLGMGPGGSSSSDSYSDDLPQNHTSSTYSMMAGAAGSSAQAGGAGSGRSNWRDGSAGSAQQQRQHPASASAASSAKRGGTAGVDAAGRPLRRNESEASSSLSAPAGGRSSQLGASGASFVAPVRGGSGTEKASGVAALMDNISEDDYGATLKLKAAQALFRLSSEPGAEPTLLQEGIVEALSKLLDMPSTAVGRLVAGALANLTCTPEAAELLLQKHGHRVLSALVGTTANTTSSSSGSSSSGNGARDDPTLAACALALCRCSSTAQGTAALVSEYNAAQSLCAIAQRQSTALRLRAARGMMNLCGLQGGGAPGFATVKHEVFLVALCGTVEELAKVELEPVQGFVCDVVGRLCGKCIALFCLR